MIRKAAKVDSHQIVEIYNYYILNTAITFEEEEITPEQMWSRIEAVNKDLPWIVYENDGVILGYAYATMWKPRGAYKHSVESTVYLNKNFKGKGIGSALYNKLLGILKTMGFHVIIGGIALPNSASIALHEKFGYRKVAHFKEVGFKFNKYVDVAYWQLLINEK